MQQLPPGAGYPQTSREYFAAPCRTLFGPVSLRAGGGRLRIVFGLVGCGMACVARGFLLTRVAGVGTDCCLSNLLCASVFYPFA